MHPCLVCPTQIALEALQIEINYRFRKHLSTDGLQLEQRSIRKKAGCACKKVANHTGHNRHMMQYQDHEDTEYVIEQKPDDLLSIVAGYTIPQERI